ncbi:hypothetical protein [Herpetosiphon sp. NSE202]|uniref:hypothetical protein n=1 Tax=Herpetosiphon sp. NSE202 TaxID=3351349 RepID=UPI003631684A
MLQSFLTAALRDDHYILQIAVDFVPALVKTQLQAVVKTLLAILAHPYAADPELECIGLGAIMLNQENLAFELCFINGSYDEYQQHKRINFLFYLLALVDQQFPLDHSPLPHNLSQWLEYYPKEYTD